METIIAVISAIIALIGAITSWFLTTKTWHKHRAIYDIERILFINKPKPPNNNDELIKKLNSGNYTILSTKDIGVDYTELILGKIKK